MSGNHQEPIGLLMAAVRRRTRQIVGAAVRGHRLTPQQFWLLVAVAELGATSIGELAERQHMDQPTASRVVAALVRRRLVRMAVDPDDRRRARLTTTPAGATLAARVRPLVHKLRVALVAGLSSSEQETLRLLLRRVVHNLESLHEVP
jgi:MarR family transcriptional regulator, lower aerobic nicotinate degradation pathway regulator